MSDVMNGRPEAEASFAGALRSGEKRNRGYWENEHGRCRRNGNRILKDTDVFFSPHSFEQCKGNGHCLPKIYLDRWQECDSNNRTSGHKSVTKKSYMVCTSGGGLICVKENGQIKAEDIPYGKHLSVAEIKELINYFFNKMGWGAEEDINDAGYIAMCMKLAGMDSRMSIEFFLLSCCMESAKGTELVQVGAKDPGRGFIQVTTISNKTYQKIAEEGNKWRILADRDPINWKSNPPGQEEIRLTFSERGPGLAWESSIGFWCFEGKGPTSYTYKYLKGKDPTKDFKAPNGIVDRAKKYMEYYDEEEPIWNFSDDTVEHWEDIYT